jgi:hypothetical protein
MHLLTTLLSAIATVVLALGLHIVLWRRITRKGLTLFLIIAACSFAAATIALPFLGLKSNPFLTLPIVLFLLLAYLHWYIGTFRSVSVRILEEIARADGSIALDALNRVYSKEWMLRSRLEVLAAHRWVTQSVDTKYQLTAKGRIFAWIIRTLRNIYDIERAG